VAEPSHRERVPGACLVWLFRAAPAQRALVSAGRRVPGIERLLSEHARRIRGNVLKVKDARYTRRLGRGTRPHVVDRDVADPRLPLVACAHAEKAR
jgi:hypothetical protein